MTDRTGVWGRSGSGKSSFVKATIRGRKRVIVFDPLGEYGAEGFKVIEHKTRDGLDRVRREMAANWGGFRLAYIPPAGKEIAALNGLSRLLLRAQSRYQATGKGAEILLVVEEMNLSFPVSGGAEKNPGFAEICSRGRHYGIEVIGVSQRIAEVATRFRGNCNETVIFAQKGPRDLDAAAAESGSSKDEIARLKSLEFFHATDAGGNRFGAIKYKGRKPQIL